MRAFIEVLKIINSPDYKPKYKGMSKELQILHGKNYLPSNLSETVESIKRTWSWRK